jgi:nitrogen fixation/metabolism regulation signal transduction histidine kinase
LWLDARYQATFTLPMVLLAAALFAGLGYVAMRRVDTATTIGLHQIEESSALLGDAEATRAALLRRQRSLNAGILLIGILLTLGLLLYGLVLSHRVAGPMHRLGRELDRVCRGDLPGEVGSLRRGDRIPALFDVFRGACMALRAEEEREVELLRRIVAAAESRTTAGAELEALRERLRVKEALLG